MNSDLTLKRLADMTYDGKDVQANQFLYKGILVNTMIAMQSQQLTESMAQRI